MKSKNRIVVLLILLLLTISLILFLVLFTIKQDKYYLHEDILTTVFWVGESASEDNHWQDNYKGAWDDLWVKHFGGVDSPECRAGFYPCDFIPLENPFYCALPYSDFNRDGVKPNKWLVPWSKDNNYISVIKNRWIKVIFENKIAYCQWEDCGPNNCNDFNYVFGNNKPSYKIGLDISPAMASYLGLDGKDTTSWQFVDEIYIPEGPWKEIITKTDACWIYDGSVCKG
jgi:hypothetical protein